MALSFVVLSLTCAAGFAQTVVEAQIDPRLAPLANPYFDILVVSVVEMESGDFTNGNPPRGKVRIDEVLRGDDERGIVIAVWRGKETLGDYNPAPQNKGGKYTPGKLKPEWYTRPLTGPSVGEKLIIFKVGRQTDGSFLLQFSYAFSEANRELVLREMAPPERKDWTQAAAFFAMVTAPVLSLICFFRLRSPVLSRSRRWILTAAILVIPLLSLATYGYYESGISIYSNIRIDVLVIWPALALAFAFWPLLGVFYLGASKRKPQ